MFYTKEGNLIIWEEDGDYVLNLFGDTLTRYDFIGTLEECVEIYKRKYEFDLDKKIICDQIEEYFFDEDTSEAFYRAIIEAVNINELNNVSENIDAYIEENEELLSLRSEVYFLKLAKQGKLLKL